MALKIVPVTLTEARRFVGEHHRHNLPPRIAMFAVGVADEKELKGVAIAGRPVARLLAAPGVLEILRTCTDGTRNANSMLYGAISRAAKALGYHTLYTYTLEGEPGASLKAAGWRQDAQIESRPTWDTPSRLRHQTDLFGEQRRPVGDKVRWKKTL